MIDTLTIDKFIWNPYIERKVHKDFDDTALFLGYQR